MSSPTEEAGQPTDFLIKSALIITAVAAIALTPFTINNFIQGRTILGVGTSTIVLLCAINTWNCLRNRYQPLIISLGLVPCIIFFLIFAFQELGLMGALWIYPATLSFYFLLQERHAWIANALLFTIVAPTAWQVLEHPIAIRYVATLLTTNVFAGVFIRYITKQQLKLETLATIDPLTGLYNRSRLDRYLETAIQQNQRTGMAISLLMIDIDHFKEINDVQGHHAGDKVLKGVGDYFQKRIRGSDSVFRIGGDEFLALLYDTSASEAQFVAKEICKEIALLPLLPNITVTASIGFAEVQPDDDLSAWKHRADKNLYLAKVNGRNQVMGNLTEKTMPSGSIDFAI
ncbi:MAG: GGDEF domain-containing protein [Methylophilaceae bacterium]